MTIKLDEKRRERLITDCRRLVLDGGKSVGAVARDFDLPESALRQWGRARPRRPHRRPHLAELAEREELGKFSKENRELRTEVGA